MMFEWAFDICFWQKIGEAEQNKEKDIDYLSSIEEILSTIISYS